MPHESFAAAHERSHPYSSAGRPPPSPQIPSELLTSSSQPELSPAPNGAEYDSEDQVWQDILEEATHDARKSIQFSHTVIQNSNYRVAYFALICHVPDEVEVLDPPAERLQCVACRRPILVATIDIGHHPILWRLAHCRHPLHLDCLAPLGRPYAISRTTQHPYYVHNPHPGLYIFTASPCIMLTFKLLAATRIRRRQHEQPFDHRPISRFEDAERIKTWPCPKEGCGEIQFSVCFRDVWYSNVHGMTMDGHSISGPTHL